MKKILSLLVAFALTQTAFGQFQKVYNLGDDYSNFIVPANGGATISGSTNKVGAGGYDALMMHFLPDGSLGWQKQFGTSGTEFGRGIAAVPGGYVMTGNTNGSVGSNGSNDVSLIKTDTAGNLIWARSYRSDSAENGYYVAPTRDGGYIITGQSKGYSQGNYDLLLIKTDSSGAVQWSKTYGSSANESGYYVTSDAEGGYLALGYSGLGSAGRNDIYVLNVDSAGDIQNQLLIGGGGDEDGRYVNFANGQMIIAGTTGSQGQNKMYALALDVNNGLSLAWANTYGGTGLEQLQSMTPSGSGYLIAGQTTSFGSTHGSSGLTFQIDSLGAVQWATVIGDSGNTYLQGALVVPGGPAFITGATDSFGHSSHSNVYIASVGPHGELCSNAHPVTLTVTPWAPSVAGPSIPALSGQIAPLTYGTVAMTQNSYTPTVEDVCAVFVGAVAGPDVNICLGSSVTIGGRPTANGGAGGYSYRWSPASGLNSDTIANPTASPVINTTYTVTVTDQNGASATASVMVHVNVPASIGLNLNHVGVVCANRGSITVTATPPGGMFSGNHIADSTYTPVAMGVDTIIYTLVDANHCTATSSITVQVEVCDGIGDIKGPSINVYPNPSNGKFIIDLGTITNSFSDIRIYDLSGALVRAEKISGSKVMMTTSLAAGSYILQVVNAGHTVYHKLTVQ